MSQLALVVEDNKINQELISAILLALDLEVTIANNGVEALECVQADRFDIILMDIHMPLMDGIEATKRIRALGGWCAVVPIIAVTADNLANDRNTYISVGLTDALSKPINMRVLSATVLGYLTDNSV